MGLTILFEGSNSERLFQGLAITAQIAFISVLFASLFGIFLGLLMTSKQKWIYRLCQLYLEIVRIIPLLVILFLVYFGFAKWFNIHWSGIGVCIAVFIFWGTAEMGDLMRAALTSIEKHQIESAYALGLNKWQTFLYILFPQSIKRVMPGVINLFTRMVKTSSLAMLIGVLEVIKVGQQIIETSLFRDPSSALWIYAVIFMLYFMICYPLSWLSRRLEQHWEN